MKIRASSKNVGLEFMTFFKTDGSFQKGILREI